MAKVWSDEELNLLSECLEKEMTLKEIAIIFEGNHDNTRTYKSIEYKSAQLKKGSLATEDWQAAPKEKTIEPYPEVKEESIVDWLVITCLTIGAIILTWWWIN